ncbi:MAG: hypothetical protein F6K47_43045 [Symploca sp. SIO2E6]|nr:hypothetical protein [Symploca sp. SIO2E6]
MRYSGYIDTGFGITHYSLLITHYSLLVTCYLFNKPYLSPMSRSLRVHPDYIQRVKLAVRRQFKQIKHYSLI